MLGDGESLRQAGGTGLAISATGTKQAREKKKGKNTYKKKKKFVILWRNFLFCVLFEPMGITDEGVSNLVIEWVIQRVGKIKKGVG